MAAVMASAMDIATANCSAEEALLDAYDLQWKAIDIRLEKLRNECERMILEYEVDMKQQMYMRECEDLMRQKHAQHDAQQADRERKLAEKDRRVEVAEVETRQLKQRSVDATQKTEEEEPVANSKRKKSTVKRKSEKQAEEEKEEENKVAALKAKTLKKPETTKKTATEKRVPRPVSPPVFSPEEDAADVAQPVVEPQAPREEDAADLSHVADNDLLEMLSQDHGCESEDFGDTSSLNLIHPQSPAMLSPKRLKKKAAFEAAALAKNAASPLRGGGASSLADRIMNRIKTVAKQPLLDPSSDASISPPPILAATVAKRALKRRKTAAMSPVASQTAPALQSKVAEKSKVASGEVDTEKQTQREKEMTKQPKKITFAKALAATDAEPESDNTRAEPEPEAEEAVQHKKSKSASMKNADAVNKPKSRSLKSKKAGKTSDDDYEESEQAGAQLEEEQGTTGAGSAEVHETATKKQERQIGAVTGRSRARQTAKMAALRAAAVDEEDDVAGFPDIKTPKVPRKKMGMDGKKKQINDLAVKRAEFQQLLSESARVDPTDDENEPPVATKKRRRQDEAVERKEPMELEFHTPKPKAKKTKITRNPFPNDELNIMKSPVPLLRAKIAEKKKQEQQAAKKATKRTVSERDDVDEDDPGYGSPAATVPATTVVAKRGPDDIAAAASDYASRWINSGLVTRAKKNAVKAARKPPSKSPKPASLWGAGPSFFDAFVNTTAPSIPRLKSTSSVPKE